MMLSGLNHCPPLRDEDPERSISREFQRLAFAAARVEIAPGIELGRAFWTHAQPLHSRRRSEEHTSELQSLMRISYAVFCLKKKPIRRSKRRNPWQVTNILIQAQENESTNTHWTSSKMILIDTSSYS